MRGGCGGVRAGWNAAVPREWRHATDQLRPLSGRYLSFSEREEIAILLAQSLGVREIARRTGRCPSTISRELRRNASTRSGGSEYRASTAQWHANRRAGRPKLTKLSGNDRLREYVQDRLAGMMSAADGATVLGPDVPWKGRRHSRREDRRWATAWSPEQIFQRLRIGFPDDESMRISHEAIYQALYVQGRGALRRELVACLRTGRALRVPRARTRGRGKKFASPEVMVSERPAEAADRAVPGHWEGDLIIGQDSSAIGTLVARTTRFTMLLQLPRMKNFGQPRVKNGPALAGHGAEAVTQRHRRYDRHAAQAASPITDLGPRRRDGAAHPASNRDGTAYLLLRPHSPWQRGTNGLLRQYFPKGTDLSRNSREEIDAVASTLNNRPRKTLGWKTTAEAFRDQLVLIKLKCVATTP